MKINNKGQAMNMLLIVGVIGLLFGTFGGAKLSKFGLFKGKPSITQKSEENREEYFKDKAKQIEYRYKHKSTSQNKQVVQGAPSTIGGRIGSFIDSSIQLIVMVIIGGFILMYFTGINIFKKIKDATLKANRYRKALKQTVKGVQVASPKLNGEDKMLKIELSKAQDEDTKRLINDMKNES